MAPFEPKIESKEFEIPAETAAIPASGSLSPEAADLTIRVWRQDAAALTWSSESVLVYMIADLVAASKGRIATETPGVMGAHFGNSLHALVAAKRIQSAILEFLTCKPGDYAGAAVLIHPPAAFGFTSGMAQGALRLAEPGQIIISEQISRTVHDLPGIELRAVPALTTGGTEHAGLSELVWTSVERLASLRNSARSNTTANPSAPVGATMIVNAPFANSQQENGRTSQQAADRLTDTDQPATKPNASVTDGLRGREVAFREGLAEFEEHQSFITGTKLVVAAIVVVLISVGLAWFHPWSGSKTGPAQSVPQVASQPTTPVQPAATTPVVPTPQPVVEPPRKVPSKPVVAKKVPVEPPKTVEPVKKPEETPIQGFEGSTTYDGMTPRDIPRLLQWARSDAGNGNYTKAAQEYRVILYMQPNNADAKEGLRKIQLAQGHDQ